MEEVVFDHGVVTAPCNLPAKKVTHRLQKGDHIKNPVRRDPLPDRERSWDALSPSSGCRKD